MSKFSIKLFVQSLIVSRDIRNDLQEYAPDVNDYPVPMAEVDGGDPAGALYHSERDYLPQLAAYKAFQRKPFKVSTEFPLN